MKGFTEVRTQADLDTFEDVIDGFVDAIVKEARLLNRGYVQIDSRSLVLGDGFDVQLVIQSQNRDHDVELVLCRVQSCELDAHVFEDGMPSSITETGKWPPREIRLGDLCAAELFYRTRPKSGRGAVLGAELPSTLAIPASVLQPGWRQCSECCDAWEEEVRRPFSRCPSCGALTELQSPE